MTEKFYRALLDYISPKEKKNLCSILQKRKMQINGFGMLKDVPAKILAPVIARNENKFLKILQESYSPTYVDQGEAVKAFSPNTAVDVLTYFWNEQNVDEELLMSLLTKAEEPTTSSPVPPPASNKAQKKADEFRQKYLAANRDLEQTKNLVEELRSENEGLKNELASKDQAIVQLQLELEQNRILHKQEITHLDGRIEELEKALGALDDSDDCQPEVFLILSKSECRIPGAVTLQFEEISKLPDMIDNYQELLFVANDLPFHIKRSVNKIAGIQRKTHAFLTSIELREYIEKGRKN